MEEKSELCVAAITFLEKMDMRECNIRVLSTQRQITLYMIGQFHREDSFGATLFSRRGLIVSFSNGRDCREVAELQGLVRKGKPSWSP